MNSEQTLQASLKNERAIFIDTLRSLTLIDIGTIVSIKDGRALVHGSSFTGGKQLIYQDAEVIFPGNGAGAYTVDCAGTPCLIFIPCSCMPNIKDRKIRFTASAYSSAGVKVMPIGNGTDNPVTVKFGEDGTYSITSEKYNVIFRADYISISRPDGASSIEIDQEGNIHTARNGQDSIYYQDLEDDKVSATFQQNNVQWDVVVQNGQLLLTQKDSNDQEIFSLTVSEEGAVTINTATDIAVSTDGDMALSAENITLNGDDKRLVTYAELKAAMDKLWTAMTTTPIVGNGSTQPTWTGITSIDISASETQTIKTGG